MWIVVIAARLGLRRFFGFRFFVVLVRRRLSALSFLSAFGRLHTLDGRENTVMVWNLE